MRWSRPIFLSVIFVAGAVSLTLLAMSPHAVSSQEAGKDLRSVPVVKVERANLDRTAIFNAELNPYQEADLHAKVAGYLKTINVDIGDRVKQGQMLAALEIPELRDDLARAHADYHDASLEYDRIRQVVSDRPGLLAQADVDKSESSYEMAKANWERAQAMVAYANITAPFNGVITKRYVDPGALVQAGTTSSSQAMPVVHVADDTTLRLVFPVPESLVPNVVAGTPVDVSVETTGQHVSSKVARISGKVDPATRTMSTEVDLDNSDHRMTPGMYADVKVLVAQKKAVLTLPMQAVSSGVKPTVWVVGEGGELQEHSVTLGMKNDRLVEITSGVTEGEEVLFGSRATVALGSHVSPKEIVEQ